MESDLKAKLAEPLEGYAHLSRISYEELVENLVGIYESQVPLNKLIADVVRRRTKISEFLRSIPLLMKSVETTGRLAGINDISITNTIIQGSFLAVKRSKTEDEAIARYVEWAQENNVHKKVIKKGVPLNNALNFARLAIKVGYILENN